MLWNLLGFDTIYRFTYRVRPLFLLPFYGAALVHTPLLLLSGPIGALYALPVPLALAGLTAVAYLMLRHEQALEASGKEEFRGEGLFSGFGEKVLDATFAVPFKVGGNGEASGELAERIGSEVLAKLKSWFAGGRVEILDAAWATNLDTREKRCFTVVRGKTVAGSMVSFVLSYQQEGRSLSMRYACHTRGVISTSDTLLFLFSAPITIWLWWIYFVRQEFSLINYVARQPRDAFDTLDQSRHFCLLQEGIVEATTAVLSEHGLLTPEAQGTIRNIFNKQIINVSRSRNVNLGRIRQAVVSSGALA